MIDEAFFNYNVWGMAYANMISPLIEIKETKYKKYINEVIILAMIQLHNGNIATSGNASIKIWSLQSMQVITTLQVSKDKVRSIIQLSDGSLLASDDECLIHHWDIIQPNKYLGVMQGHTSIISAMTQLRDGKIASGSTDKSVIIWDSSTKQIIARLVGHNGFVRPVIQLKDKRIVTGSGDCDIFFWNSETYKFIRKFSGHTSWVFTLCELSDETMASGSWDYSIKIWDVKKMVCRVTFDHHHCDKVLSIIQLFDGRIMTSSNDKTIKYWDYKEKECLSTLEKHEGGVHTLIQLIDGRIVSGGYDRKIIIWDWYL